GGSFGEERMRLIISREGPTLLSRFSTTQAVGRNSPRAAACLAVVSHPAATNASRISASFNACLALATESIWTTSRLIAFLFAVFHPAPSPFSPRLIDTVMRNEISSCSNYRNKEFFLDASQIH